MQISRNKHIHAHSSSTFIVCTVFVVPHLCFCCVGLSRSLSSCSALMRASLSASRRSASSRASLSASTMPNSLYSFTNFLHSIMLKGALSALALAACFALVVLLSPQKNNLLASRKYLHIAVYVNRVNRHKIGIWNRMVNTLDMPVDNAHINSHHIPSVTTCRFVVWFVVANEICEVIHGDCIF